MEQKDRDIPCTTAPCTVATIIYQCPVPEGCVCYILWVWSPPRVHWGPFFVFDILSIWTNFQWLVSPFWYDRVIHCLNSPLSPTFSSPCSLQTLVVMVPTVLCNTAGSSELCAISLRYNYICWKNLGIYLVLGLQRECWLICVELTKILFICVFFSNYRTTYMNFGKVSQVQRRK